MHKLNVLSRKARVIAKVLKRMDWAYGPTEALDAAIQNANELEVALSRLGEEQAQMRGEQDESACDCAEPEES